MMLWRDVARPIIARVIREVGLEDEAELRKALRHVYPWGMRENHPYRIWCDEIKRQIAAEKMLRSGLFAAKRGEGEK